MAVRRVLAVAGLVMVVTGMAAVASQPEVKLSDLRPSFALQSSNALALLLVDPWAEAELTMVPVSGYATLDVDADPFVVR